MSALTIIAYSNAEAMSKWACNKLQPQTAGPFKTITVQEKTLTIDEDGILYTVSADRVTRAPDTTNTNCHQLHENLQHVVFLQQESIRKDAPRGQEFMVQKIVRHIGTGQETKDVVRWYGYSSSQDTVGLPDHLLTHFITRYWGRIEIKKTQQRRNVPCVAWTPSRSIIKVRRS